MGRFLSETPSLWAVKCQHSQLRFLSTKQEGHTQPRCTVQRRAHWVQNVTQHQYMVTLGKLHHLHFISVVLMFLLITSTGVWLSHPSSLRRKRVPGASLWIIRGVINWELILFIHPVVFSSSSLCTRAISYSLRIWHEHHPYQVASRGTLVPLG